MELFVAIYVDHILIMPIHKDKIRDANMTLKLAKCKFIRPSVKFLGSKFSRLGIERLPDGVEAIQNVPRPKSKCEMQFFFDVINFY